MKIINEDSRALGEAKLPRRVDRVVASVLGIVCFLYATVLFNVVSNILFNLIFFFFEISSLPTLSYASHGPIYAFIEHSQSSFPLQIVPHYGYSTSGASHLLVLSRSRTCIHAGSYPSKTQRRTTLVQKMQCCKTATSTSLSPLWPLRLTNGSPLRMD